ncbi:MAG: GAF domain-containing protein [Candidatus Competibacterales bacterium]
MDHFDTAVNSFQLKTALADAGRLRALEETALLHTLPDPEFDRLTRLATQLLAAPVSLVSLVAEDHQFFKSQQGLSEPWATERCTPLSHSFCQYLVASGEPLIVEDARLDPRLATNAAIEALKVVAYAGVPLRDRDGAVLGSLCAIDHRPRVWSSEQIASLTDLAAIAATTVERQRLGRQLQTRNAQLHTLADALPAAIYYCDADECFGFVNAAAARSLGGDSAALLGESQRTILGDVAYQAVAPHIEKALAGAPQCCQMTRQTPEGPRELEVHYVPQRGVAGAVVGFYVLELDIGDRLRLEEQRLRSSKLEMVGQMAGRVAHDFNNVLQVVRGNLELLSQAAGDADQREMIEDALSATHHGASLIQQLRAVSQYQSAQRQPLALADFLPKFARLARRLLSDEVTLVTELADPHLTLHADSHQLEAALLNLVTNARDALPSGGRIALAVTPHRQGGLGPRIAPGSPGGSTPAWRWWTTAPA